MVEISFCWNCLDVITEDLKRASQTASAGERRARLIQAMPGWADRKAIKAVYEEARRISRETGIPHQVDHEIPLNSPFVSGFHVAENLQILPARENLKKSNRLNVNSKAIKCKSEQPKESVEAILDHELKGLLAQAAKQESERRIATMKPRLIKRK